MEKYKILVIPSDRSGVSHFRSVKPHLKLEELYGNEFSVEINMNVDFNDTEYLKQFDLVHYHKQLVDLEVSQNNLKILKDLGIKSVMDIDDYWELNQYHASYNIAKHYKIFDKILDNIKNAEYVTTTTDYFKNIIKKYNKNVSVLENAIDKDEPQYQIENITSDRIRIGWLGGASHAEDLKNLNGLVNRIKNDGLLDKVQFVLCGFDTRGKVNYRDKKTGKPMQRDMKPTETVWYQYEKIFTDNYSIISDDYKKYLFEFNKGEYNNVDNEPYRRVWTKPVTSYASNYNLFDISLAPLKDTLFNRCKSNLKVIEAGFFKKALICQNIEVYSNDIKHAYVKPKDKKSLPQTDLTANGYLVTNDNKEWYKYLKRLILNPKEIEILGNNLYNTITNKYELSIITEKRYNLYKEILKK